MVRPLVRCAARALAAGSVVALLASPALAQNRERLVRIGFTGGGAVPIGDLSDVTNAGLSAQGFVQIAPPGFPATFRLGAFYSRLSGKDGSRLTLPPTVPGSQIAVPPALVDGTQLLGGLGQIRYDLSRGSVRPYVIAGVGAYNVRQTFAQLQSGNSVDKVRVGVDGGAGFSFNFGGADAFIEARLTNLFSTTGVAPELGSIRVIPISFGVVF